MRARRCGVGRVQEGAAEQGGVLDGERVRGGVSVSGGVKMGCEASCVGAQVKNASGEAGREMERYGRTTRRLRHLALFSLSLLPHLLDVLLRAPRKTVQLGRRLRVWGGAERGASCVRMLGKAVPDSAATCEIGDAVVRSLHILMESK